MPCVSAEKVRLVSCVDFMLCSMLRFYATLLVSVCTMLAFCLTLSLQMHDH